MLINKILLLFLTVPFLVQGQDLSDTTQFGAIDTIEYSEDAGKQLKWVHYTPHSSEDFRLFFDNEFWQMTLHKKISVLYTRYLPTDKWQMVVLDSIIKHDWPQKYEKQDYAVPVKPAQIDTVWSADEPVPVAFDTITMREVNANGLYEVHSKDDLQEIGEWLVKMHEAQPNYLLHISTPARPVNDRTLWYRERTLTSWNKIIRELEDKLPAEWWLRVELYTPSWKDGLPGFVFLVHYMGE